LLGPGLLSTAVATVYGLNDLQVGVRVSVRSRIFTFSYRSGRFWNPHSLQSNGYRGYFSGIKRQGCEAEHSPQTSAEVKKNVNLHIHFTMDLHGVVLS
jgi:hypothetical protein